MLKHYLLAALTFASTLGQAATLEISYKAGKPLLQVMVTRAGR